MDKRKFERAFLIGPHYSMERFGVLFCFCLSLFVILGVWWVIYDRNKSNEEYDNTTIYTTVTTTSITKTPVSMLGLFKNEDQNKAALLMKFGDLSRISSDAQSYRCFIGALDKKGKVTQLKLNSNVSLYMYGTTGYMVATFDNGTTFPEQIVKVFFGSVKSVTGDTVTGGLDPSESDMWIVDMNFGADQWYKTSAFDNGSFDADGFFAETISTQAENTIRKDLNDDLSVMYDLIARCNEYADRVERNSLDVESMIPEWFSGDRVINEDGAYSLVTSTVCPGGFDFDWRNGDVNTGYLSRLMVGSEAESKSVYLSQMVAQQQPFSYSAGIWHMQDGTTFESYAQINASAKIDEIRGDIEELEKAWQAYAKVKSKYQITDLTRLLQLEIDADSMRGNITSNENVITAK